MPRKSQAPTEAVREPIKQMTGFSSVEEMSSALPDNTMAGEPSDAKPARKPRRTKAEMAASRGENSPTEAEVDPLMADPVYRKAVERMRSAGLSSTVKGGFKTAAVIADDPEWELEKEEIEDVDGFSYVVSKKYPIMDPTHHWATMILYFVVLMGTLIFKRAAKMHAETWMKKLTEMFGGEETLDAQELENQKAQSV